MCTYICLLYRYGPQGSAICVYSADLTGNTNGIFTVFNGEYYNLQPGQTTCTANHIPNDNPFTVSIIFFSKVALLYVMRDDFCA